MTNRILCHEHKTLLKLNFFQLVEQHRSWDSVLISIYQLSAHDLNKAVLEPRVSPAFAITYFAIIVILHLKIYQSMWIHWLFPKTWTKGHWPLDDLWPHVCWGHMCDSTQGSLCPSPMTIHQCMWIQWSILQNTTYIHTHTTYILHTTYRMSDHIVSYWTQFRRDKNGNADATKRWKNDLRSSMNSA